jgi:sugar phosphate isomerase/epimerase
MMNIRHISVFTKPWKKLDADALGALTADMGFSAIEYPLRDGYPVGPSNAGELTDFAETLGKHGVKITSVAAGETEEIFEACAEAGVPLLRVMRTCDRSEDYRAVETHWKRELETRQMLCAKYGVRLGIQMHCGCGAVNAASLMSLLDGSDPTLVCGVWDAAHSALAGEQPEQSLAQLWPRLGLVNLKNAFWRRISGPEAAHAVFSPYFTTATQGACVWERVITYLSAHCYDGDLCMPAEYTDFDNTETYIRGDLRFLKGLLEKEDIHV